MKKVLPASHCRAEAAIINIQKLPVLLMVLVPNNANTPRMAYFARKKTTSSPPFSFQPMAYNTQANTFLLVATTRTGLLFFTVHA